MSSQPTPPSARSLLLATALGIALGWLPTLIHGPIPERFDAHGLRGGLAVWAWYLSRMSIGFWVGATVWPRAPWLRGVLVGFLVMLPVGFVSLAMPACGFG